jgi:3D-(3,5/4)-trihydroxycyclohexane-1,2-dione acylhydrolase (decyclizing)
MSPQVLIDAVQHGVRGTIVIFDNRRMAAISALQLAQYAVEYRTNDMVEVDYVRLASAVKGVNAVWGGTSVNELQSALTQAHDFPGLSVIHVPVYYGADSANGMGAYGQWNVGNWCSEVQDIYARQTI